MILTIVPHGHVHEVLPHIVGFAGKGAAWTLGRLDTDDVVSTFFQKDITLWVLFDDSDVVHGYLTTKIIDYPQARHFCVLTCGGMEGSLDACVDLVFDTFERYARESGCDGFEITGRPAWWKNVKGRGFDRPQQQFFKKFKE